MWKHFCELRCCADSQLLCTACEMSQHGCPERLSNRSKGYTDDGPSQPTMEVLVETLTGTAFEMTVLPTDTIFAIKSKIFRVEGEWCLFVYYTTICVFDRVGLIVRHARSTKDVVFVRRNLRHLVDNPSRVLTWSYSRVVPTYY